MLHLNTLIKINWLMIKYISFHFERDGLNLSKSFLQIKLCHIKKNTQSHSLPYIYFIYLSIIFLHIIPHKDTSFVIYVCSPTSFSRRLSLNRCININIFWYNFCFNPKWQRTNYIVTYFHAGLFKFAHCEVPMSTGHLIQTFYLL